MCHSRKVYGGALQHPSILLYRPAPRCHSTHRHASTRQSPLPCQLRQKLQTTMLIELPKEFSTRRTFPPHRRVNCVLLAINTLVEQQCQCWGCSRVFQGGPTYPNMLGYTLDGAQSITYQQITPRKWWSSEQEVVGLELPLSNLLTTFMPHPRASQCPTPDTQPHFSL